jgi:hypothetical protein
LLLSSPDIVFEVWGMGLDGSRPMRLVPNGGSVSEAHWSPQGNRVAFVATAGPYSHVFMHERATGQVRQLTSGEHVNSSLAFSPDGQRLAFVSTRDGNLEIYTMRVDGSAQTRLTDFLEDDAAPAWSPDGRQIAFLRNGDRRDVWVMNADGSQARNLTHSPKVDDVEPVWAPDGARILFGTRRNDDIAISSIAPDGSDRKTLIANKAKSFVGVLARWPCARLGQQHGRRGHQQLVDRQQRRLECAGADKLHPGGSEPRLEPRRPARLLHQHPHHSARHFQRGGRWRGSAAADLGHWPGSATPHTAAALTPARRLHVTRPLIPAHNDPTFALEERLMSLRRTALTPPLADDTPSAGGVFSRFLAVTKV